MLISKSTLLPRFISKCVLKVVHHYVSCRLYKILMQSIDASICVFDIVSSVALCGAHENSSPPGTVDMN